MNIGILGGTFDPIHNGHLLLAREAGKQFALAKVLFVPAFIPPHKTHRQDGASAEDRCAMIQAALKETKGWELCRIEIERGGVSYTVDTLRALKHLYPQDTLYVILGADTYAGFSGWREPDAVRKMARLLVAPRPGSQPVSGEPAGVATIQMTACPYASSEIRRAVGAGRHVPQSVPEAVRQFIEKKALYTEN